MDISTWQTMMMPSPSQKTLLHQHSILVVLSWGLIDKILSPSIRASQSLAMSVSEQLMGLLPVAMPQILLMKAPTRSTPSRIMALSLVESYSVLVSTSS